MPTIAEHEAKMTIYYYKSDGTIFSYGTGISDISIFGDRAKDYEQIVDYVVMDRDKDVMEFLNRFYIDIETKELKLKMGKLDLSRYM